MNYITKLVPNLNFEDLLVSCSKWADKMKSLYDLGILWEKIIASSLAVKYILYREQKKLLATDSVKLSEIYELGEKAQAYPLLSSVNVNFSLGMRNHKKEVNSNDNLSRAVYLNSNVRDAHHDIILSADPHNVAIQCKNSFKTPDGGIIKRQLDCEYLLWFFMGWDEENSIPPVDFRESEVIAALKEKRLGFVNGSGCTSLVVYDLINALKIVLLTNRLFHE